MTANFDGPDVLDVTLRDGSYVIDFQFTAHDTYTIGAALESVGVRWIEIGHGLGLNASNAGSGAAGASDESYLEAAADAIKTAKWGMFCIPGIARLEDIDMAARYGMHFIRIGTDVTNYERARPFIERAKEQGLYVSYNAMKSYAVSPEEFAVAGTAVSDWGADIVALVDSAGGMFPDEITAYFKACRAAGDFKYGFHGHDNLALAMANTLRALEEGASLVDSSLQGMGRSAGNTVTESLIAVMKYRGLVDHIDLNGIVDVGQAFIAPLLKSRRLDAMAFTAGFSRFHSSLLPKVERYAARYGLDPRDLIIKLTKKNLVSAPDELLEELCRELQTVGPSRIRRLPSVRPKMLEPSQDVDGVVALVKELRPQARKAGLETAVNLVLAPEPRAAPAVSGNVYSSASHVVGSVTVGDEPQLIAALKAIDGKVDHVLLDIDSRSYLSKRPEQIGRDTLRESTLLSYSDTGAWVRAAQSQVLRLLDECIDGVPVVVVGAGRPQQDLARDLARRGAEVTLVGAAGSSPNAEFSAVSRTDGAAVAACLGGARAVVVWTEGGESLSVSDASVLQKGALVLEPGVGSIDSAFVDAARERGALVVRIDIWPELTSTLEGAATAHATIKFALGAREMGGVPIVAGGVWGRAGDVVVDSISQPSRVIGIANGDGRLRQDLDKASRERIHTVARLITEGLLNPGRPADES